MPAAKALTSLDLGRLTEPLLLAFTINTKIWCVAHIVIIHYDLLDIDLFVHWHWCIFTLTLMYFYTDIDVFLHWHWCIFTLTLIYFYTDIDLFLHWHWSVFTLTLIYFYSDIDLFLHWFTITLICFCTNIDLFVHWHWSIFTQDPCDGGAGQYGQFDSYINPNDFTSKVTLH